MSAPNAPVTPGTRVTPGSILFLCGQNAIRSPMAEVIARHRLPAHVLVRSAGLRSGTRDPFVDEVVAEAGLPLVPHDPRALEEMEDDLFDVIVALTPEAAAHARDLARTAAMRVVEWDIPDPSMAEGRREMVLDAYRAVRDRLDALIGGEFGSAADQETGAADD